MGWRKNNPGCPCCGCTKFSEHFTSSAWQSRYDYSGSWSQSGTVLTISDDDAELTSKQDHEGVMWTYGLWADVPQSWDPEDPDTHDFADYELRVKVKDANNYIFLKISWLGVYSFEDPPGTPRYSRQWTMQLFERIGGVDSAISEAITYSADIMGYENFNGATWDLEPGYRLPLCLKWITLCVDPWEREDDYYGTETADRYEVRSSVWDFDPVIGDEGLTNQQNPFLKGVRPRYVLRGDTSQTAAFGDNHGVKVSAGAIASGVDAIKAHEYTDDCRVCGCSMCLHGTSPEVIDVTFDDIEPEDYDDLNGITVRLYRGRALARSSLSSSQEPWDEFENGVCYYSGEIDHPVAGLGQVLLVLELQTKVYVSLYPTAYVGNDMHITEQTINPTGEPIDCYDTLDGYVLETWTYGSITAGTATLNVIE